MRELITYKNEVEILGKNWCLSTDRIFSKTESFKPSINLADNWKKKMIKLTSENHFEKMFNHFYYLTTNSKAERLRG